MRRSIHILFALTLGTAMLACGGRQGPDPSNYAESAEYAYESAEHAFERRDYELARSRYIEVYQNYPYSQYAALAELRLADCHFEERTFVRAAEAYRRFVRFHPTHPLVPRAEFQVAMSYVRQMPGDWFLMPPSHERQLTDAVSAYESLRYFMREYADSEYAEEASAELERVRDRLAAHELYVAEFYLRRDNFRAAATRSQNLFQTYPDAASVPNALFIYARAMLSLDDLDQAVAALRRLRDDHPDTELGIRAVEYLQQYGL